MGSTGAAPPRLTRCPLPPPARPLARSPGPLQAWRNSFELKDYLRPAPKAAGAAAALAAPPRLQPHPVRAALGLLSGLSVFL
jgi:hypothetical protein